MSSNRKQGTAFEETFCEMLCAHGFWAHNMAQTASGQPADVIAARYGKGYLIDCKVCCSNIFPLSRVEDNQSLAMNFWMETGNGEGWFALYVQEAIIMIPFSIVKNFGQVKSSMSLKDIHELGTPFEEWVTSCK